MEKDSSQKFMTQVQKEFEMVEKFQETVVGKDIVAFLGNTGVGKSTLINLLAGIDLKIDENGSYALANPDNPNAMPIGTINQSKTLYPKAIQIEKFHYLDFPGFNDTNGSERNLVNSALIRQVLLNAASVRLVFVAGEEQFITDGAESINKTFVMLQQLFDFDDQKDFVDKGILVVTKSIDNLDILSNAVKDPKKAKLHTQLKKWRESNKLFQILNVRTKYGKNEIHNENLQTSKKIVKLISESKFSVKVKRINVSVLYPPKTNDDLKSVFLIVMEKMFQEKFDPNKFKASNTKLSEFDKLIANLESGDFWNKFEIDLCQEKKEIALLKPFCINAYNNARQTFEEEKREIRSQFLKTLKNQQNQRIEDIQNRTESRSKEVVAKLAPKVLFDFGYHKDFRQAVCGDEEIRQLATDPNEQEIVKDYYMKVFINRHMDQQMLRWLDKDQLINKNRQLSNRLDELEPLCELLCKNMGKLQNTFEEERKSLQNAMAENKNFYERFTNGALIYKPDPNSDNGKVVMPIRKLMDPLEGTFDLSGCGKASQYFSISVGYKKCIKPENKDKMEIWIVPRYLLVKEFKSVAESFSAVIKEWEKFPAATIGIFRTWGKCDILDWYSYLIDKSLEQIDQIDLVTILGKANICKPKESSSESYLTENVKFSKNLEITNELKNFRFAF